MRSPRRSSGRGFTLLELLFVAALVGFVASLTMVIGFDAIVRSGVHEERDLLAALLVGQRAKALANINERAHGLRVQNDSYVLFEGSVFSVGDPGNRMVDRNHLVVVTPAAPIDIVFNQLSATTTAVSLMLTDGAASQALEVNALGRIDW